MLRISCVRSCSNRPHLSFSKNYVRELVCVRLVFISLVIATDSFAGIGDPCLSLHAFWESLKSGPLHRSLMKWKAPYRIMVLRTLEMGGGCRKGVYLLWNKRYGRVAQSRLIVSSSHLSVFLSNCVKSKKEKSNSMFFLQSALFHVLNFHFPSVCWHALRFSAFSSDVNSGR